jgi:hypothetical protein
MGHSMPPAPARSSICARVLGACERAPFEGVYPHPSVKSEFVGAKALTLNETAGPAQLGRNLDRKPGRESDLAGDLRLSEQFAESA